MESLKNIFAALIIIFNGGFFIWHFLMVWKYGRIYVFESNSFILWLEIVCSVGLIAFGVERLVYLVKNRKRQRYR